MVLLGSEEGAEVVDLFSAIFMTLPIPTHPAPQ